jgi:hypothetical protein
VDTAAICSAEALDLAELLAFPHLIAGGQDVLLAEAGARRAAQAEAAVVAPAAPRSAPGIATRRRRQLRLRLEWREPAAVASHPAA